VVFEKEIAPRQEVNFRRNTVLLFFYRSPKPLATLIKIQSGRLFYENILVSKEALS
jgi:hypothetical protein